MSQLSRLKSKNYLQPDFSIVLCAGGKSSRFRATGSSVSKQFFEWDQRPLFLHTLDRFRELSPYEAVLVVPASAKSQYLERLSAEDFPFKLKIVEGGERRQDSVRAGLYALSKIPYVGIHDAARPFVSLSLLRRLTEQVRELKAVIPVVPIVETLKEVDAEGKVLKSLKRERIQRVQTPQFFDYERILDVHRRLEGSGSEFTDDAMMMEHFQFDVWTCPGDVQNIKVTTTEDLRILARS